MLPRILALRGSPGAEHMSAAETRALQEERLQAIVAHAYHNTRFWREWFDSAGIRPEDIRTLDDLSKIPLCTKGDLLRRPEADRLSEPPDRCMRASTSGSTGGPLSVFYSKRYADYLMSNSVFRIPRMTGLGVSSKLLGIAFAVPSKIPEDPDLPSRTPPSRVFGVAGTLFRPLIHRFKKTVYISYGIGDRLDEIVSFRPGHIYGTPAYLRLLADVVRAEGIKKLRPKGVFLTGEPLDEPTRRYIDETFGCKTYDGYGANEFGLLAVECRERHGMHVMSDMAVVEVVKDGRAASPGEAGELVITGLLNEAMPLIRYRIGDIGVMSDKQCSCGLTMPILASVEGRSMDHIRLHDGRAVSPKKVTTLMHGIDGLPRAQLIQKSLNAFALRVFDKGAGRNPAVDEFLQTLRAELAEGVVMDVRYESPDQLKAKFRPVLSQVTGQSALAPEPTFTEGTANRKAAVP